MAKKSIFSSKREKEIDFEDSDFQVEKKKGSFLSKLNQPLFSKKGDQAEADSYDFEEEDVREAAPKKRSIFTTARHVTDVMGEEEADEEVKEKKSLSFLAAKARGSKKAASPRQNQGYTLFGKGLKGNFLAVDFDDEEVRILVARHKRQELEILNSLKAQLPESTVLNGDLLEPAAMADTIEQLLQEYGVSAKYAFFSVSNADVIARPVSVPAVVAEEDIEGMISFELQQYLDIDPTAYVIEYQESADALLSNSGTDEDEMRSLMAYAVPRHTVEQYLAVANHLGMTPYVFDLQSNTLEKWLERVEAINNRAKHLTEQNVGVIHLTKKAVDVFLYARGQFVTSNHLGTGYERLVEVMDSPSVIRSLPAIASGEVSNFVVKDALDDWASNTATHILNTENFYTTTTNEVIQSLYVFGEEELCLQLAPVLKKRLGRDLEVVSTMDCQDLIWGMEADFSSEFIPAAAALIRRGN